MLGLLVAGLVFLVVGVLAIGFGIPIKEFSVGNTLIGSGVAGTCTGAILIALALLLRELQGIARALATRQVVDPHHPDMFADSATVAGEGVLRSTRDPGLRIPERAVPSTDVQQPWQGEWRSDTAPRDPADQADLGEDAAPAPATDQKRRRNLMFRSSVRDRATSSGDESNVEPDAQAEEAPASETGPSFREARAAPDRQRSDISRRPLRAAAEIKNAPPPIRRPAESPPVTVLKSGVVDGMAYSLYSDGSIEAQMPEGMVRFASIDELRRHLDQRT